MRQRKGQNAVSQDDDDSDLEDDEAEEN